MTEVMLRLEGITKSFPGVQALRGCQVEQIINMMVGRIICEAAPEILENSSQNVVF